MYSLQKHTVTVQAALEGLEVYFLPFYHKPINAFYTRHFNIGRSLETALPTLSLVIHNYCLGHSEIYTKTSKSGLVLHSSLWWFHLQRPLVASGCFTERGPRPSLLELQDSYSKSDVRRNFHKSTNEAMVDLRDHMRTGKRFHFQGMCSHYFRNRTAVPLPVA